MPPHICVSESGEHLFTQWLVAYSAPSHYLNQCWVIVNWTPGNKVQWDVNQITKLFIHENSSKNIVCEMAAVLSRGGIWANSHKLMHVYPCAYCKTFKKECRLYRDKKMFISTNFMKLYQPRNRCMEISRAKSLDVIMLGSICNTGIHASSCT